VLVFCPLLQISQTLDGGVDQLVHHHSLNILEIKRKLLYLLRDAGIRASDNIHQLQGEVKILFIYIIYLSINHNIFIS
jgi:hypothetical protein